MSTFGLTDWLANFSATASWLPKLSGTESNYLLPNTWTLCYEEQFYIVTGILLTLSARRFFLASYVIAAATLVARHVCRYNGLPIDGFFFDGHWLLFVCGILLYQHINYLKGSPARWAIAVLAMGGDLRAGRTLAGRRGSRPACRRIHSRGLYVCDLPVVYQTLG